MDIVAKGIVSGIVLAFLIGPVFFTIIQTSIERGFSKGVLVAVGVSASDAVYIVLSYLGLSQLIANESMKVYLGYAGGGVLLSFGIYYLFFKNKKILFRPTEQPKQGGFFRYIIKGFVINGISPMVLVFWIGTVGLATSEFGYTTTIQASIYFSTIVATVFVTDVLKAKLADKLRALITTRSIRILNITLGIVFIIFGGRLLLYADKIPGL
jgi:threonine/homoserine/homoserine lactone efflux protein